MVIQISEYELDRLRNDLLARIDRDKPISELLSYKSVRDYINIFVETIKETKR